MNATNNYICLWMACVSLLSVYCIPHTYLLRLQRTISSFFGRLGIRESQSFAKCKTSHSSLRQPVETKNGEEGRPLITNTIRDRSVSEERTPRPASTNPKKTRKHRRVLNGRLSLHDHVDPHNAGPCMLPSGTRMRQSDARRGAQTTRLCPAWTSIRS
jgi:hypothetical protein